MRMACSILACLAIGCAGPSDTRGTKARRGEVPVIVENPRPFERSRNKRREDQETAMRGLSRIEGAVVR